MSEYEDVNDPITELLNTEPHEDNDIQVINRSNPTNQASTSQTNTSNNSNNDNLSLTPLLNQAQLYTGFDNEHHENSHNPEPPTGRTPLFLPQDLASPLHHGLMSQDLHNQMVINSNYHPQIQQLKQYQELQHQENQQPQIQLPALPPLSESAIPTGISFNPRMFSRPEDQRQMLTQSQPPASSSKRRRENAGTKSRPAFVMKIWSMVNDPSNQEYIRWNEDGKTFQVFYREEFMKKILPKYFKHNNFASFVRQLNMYGWHKVQDISNGTLNQNMGKDKGGVEETWKFENPNFIRDREDLLERIVRNKSGEETVGGSMSEDVNLPLILKELEAIKMNQYVITEDLRRIRKDNKTLWQETYLTRERNQNQARTLEKILKFLTTVYGNSNAGKILEVDQGQFNQMMTQYKPQPAPRPPTAQTSAPNGAPYYRPRLMLTEDAHKQTNSPPSVQSTRPARVPSQVDSTPGTIEEIIRNYDTDKSNTNSNSMYQHLLDPDPIASLSSPRQLFPELHGSSMPSEPIHHTNFGVEEVEDDDMIKGLQQNIDKQGQSIQQVQDWIERLAKQNENQEDPTLRNGQEHHDDDTFDVNEFLEGTATPVNVPTIITPGSNATPSETRKRSIQEVYDGNEY